MKTSAILGRLARLGWRDHLILIEALLALAVASISIRLLPFRRVARIASGRHTESGITKSADEDEVSRLCWAVDVWSRRVPWRAVCFQRGLAAHLMLRRRGLGSILHYGIARPEHSEALATHVWISLDGRLLLGGKESWKYTCVSTFPAASAGQPD